VGFSGGGVLVGVAVYAGVAVGELVGVNVAVGCGVSVGGGVAVLVGVGVHIVAVIVALCSSLGAQLDRRSVIRTRMANFLIMISPSSLRISTISFNNR
jgi:hypothetical protein